MSNLICNFAPQKLAKMKDYANRRLPSTLHKLRKQYKLTQKDLADNLGISVAMYSKIELGKRMVKSEHLPKLARSLRADVNEFYSLYLADKIDYEALPYPKQVINKAFELIQHHKNLLA